MQNSEEAARIQKFHPLQKREQERHMIFRVSFYFLSEKKEFFTRLQLMKQKNCERFKKTDD